jgi:4-hydroxybenzoate polyprenyltransferase
MRVWHKIGATLEMIKWELSIFALPFALTATMLATLGWPRLYQLIWIVVCMVFARSAGTAFNRWADAELDARNPRTRMRAIPVGQLTKSFVGGFTIVTSLLFLIAASQLNRLTLLLAPAELGLILFCSYTKRFTLDPKILVLTLIVLCWVGGFDTLYACQDAEHDRREGLKSLPATIGVGNAFWLARTLHVAMLVLALWLIHLFALGPLSWAGVIVVSALLLYEHSIVSPGDLTRMNAVFFTMNGVISVVFFVFVVADILIRKPS